jgi:septal ring factor EnvC (AmiA/AmiB activator)
MNRISLILFVGVLCLPILQVRAEGVHEIKRKIRIHEERIGEVQKELERSQAQVEVMRQQERKLLDRLDTMEQQLQRIQKKLDKSRRQRSFLRKEIAHKQEKLDYLNRELGKLRVLLARRLGALYKFGRQAYVDLLVSPRDVSGLQHHWIYLRAMAQQDSELVRRFLEQQRQEEKLMRALASRESELTMLVTKIDEEKVDLEKVKRKQVTLLQDIHTQEEMYQRYVAELATVSRELRDKIEELQKKAGNDITRVPRLGGGFVSKKGALPYPAPGQIVSRFGPKKHKKFGTKIRCNGIEIATKPLSPVVAVYGGQILYAERVKGYGKVIIVDHGDKYYTLTAHLADITKEAGEVVTPGEIIGYAGYSCKEKYGGRVYFEVRHLGKAQNPEKWLLPALASGSASGT